MPFHDDDDKELVRPERRAQVHDVRVVIEVPQGGAGTVREAERQPVDRGHTRGDSRQDGVGESRSSADCRSGQNSRRSRPGHDNAAHEARAIVVSVKGATVAVLAGSVESDVLAVLRAMAAL